MAANSWGSHFVVTTFGESHGKALGAVVDGCPSQVPFDQELLLKNLKRRRPGSHGNKENLTSSREEQDFPDLLSGIFEGKTLGTPIAMTVTNRNQCPKDYQAIKNVPRPGHADDVWKNKFGHVDYRGGGRSSGRETLGRVIAGSVAQMFLREISPDSQVIGFASTIGPVSMTDSEVIRFLQTAQSTDQVDCFSTRMPDVHSEEKAKNLLLTAKQEGKSYGGVVQVLVKHPPPNLGQPVFHKLKADLVAAFMSVGAVCGVELGDALLARQSEGSQFHSEKDQSQYGGIRGGVSTGENIRFQVSFKPTASVLHTAVQGRHDPCILIRAIPVLEAMAYIVLADHWLWSKTDKIGSLITT